MKCGGGGARMNSLSRVEYLYRYRSVDADYSLSSSRACLRLATKAAKNGCLLLQQHACADCES